MKLQHQFVLAGLAVSIFCLSIAGVLQIELNHHARLEERINEVLDTDHLITRSSLLNTGDDESSGNSNPFSQLRFNLLMRGGILGLYTPEEIEQSDNELSDPIALAMGEINQSERGYILSARNARHFLTVYQWLDYKKQIYFKSVRFDITSTIEIRFSEYRRFLLLLFFTIAILFILFSLISSRLSRSLRLLSIGVHGITAGDFSKRLKLKGNREVSSLSSDFNAMAQTLEEKHRALEQRNQAQNELLRNITHELRIPLTNIMGYAEMVQTREAPIEEILNWNEYIEREAMRLLNTSTLLRNYILLEDKAITVTPINSADFFESVQQSCSVLVKEKDINLRFDYAKSVINGNIDLLTAACINLIDNAIKASHSGKEIRIIMTEDTENTIISIIDKGTGIARDELEKINDPLYQTDKARTSGKTGLGLGLSIAKMIMELHKGSIELTSQEGKGTTARLSWPSG